MSEYENQKAKISSLFQLSSIEYWLTIEEIINATKIQTHDVVRILTSSGDFVRSSYRSKNGEPVYTTRVLFRQKAPFVDKMIGAFKNRID